MSNKDPKPKKVIKKTISSPWTEKSKELNNSLENKKLKHKLALLKIEHKEKTSSMKKKGGSTKKKK